MAPTVADRLASSALASSSTHAITMPAGATTARGVLVVTTWDSAPTASTASAGWSKIAEASAGPVGGALFYKRPGVTLTALTVDLSFAEEGTYVVLAVDAAAAAEDVYAASGAGTSANPDPPSLTPPGGSRDYLWITAYGREAASSASAAPSGYANLTTAAGGPSGAGTQTAERTVTAATEDPGAWTATAEDHVVWTIAVPPAAGATTAPAGHASGTGTAAAATAAVRPAAGHASGTGTASQPAVSTTGATTAPAGHAAGTGTARAPAASVRPVAGQATGTGTAHQPTVTTLAITTAPAGHASGTGIAHQPVGAATATRASAGHASGTGLARQPTVQVPLGTGVVLLPDHLAQGRLSVEIAWGADLAADPDTWTWTDIASDVRYDDRITITIGRSDEAAAPQPATCNLTLDNRAGLYSLGGQSPNWPNVRRNTPVRVRVSLDNGTSWSTRFQGYAVGFTPQWDSTGRDATVALEAAGVTRRLKQGNAPVLSTLRRSVLASAAAGVGVRAYWPCEDPPGSTSIAPGLPGVGAMTITGDAEFPYPKWAANSDDFLCSRPLPEVNGTVWRGVVPDHAATGQVQVRMLLGIPAAGAATTEETLFSVYTTGTLARWDVRYQVGGALDLEAYDTAGALAFSANGAFNSDNTRRRISLQLSQDGADVDYTLRVVPVEAFSGGGGLISGTVASDTIGRATAVAINPGGLITDTVIGHITVEDAITSAVTDQPAFNARLGESNGPRLQRLCDEAGIELEIIGTGGQPMAAQPVDQLLPLIREVDTADGGVIHDGLSAGLTYVTFIARSSEAPALTLDVAQLARALEPVLDDQGVRNRVTTTSRRGGEFTAEDTDGPMGTAAIGVYDTSLDVSGFYSTGVSNIAGIRLARGTVEGYRHPRLQLDLARNPDLADDWLTITLASRIDVTGIDTVRTQHPAGTVSQIVEGWTERLDQLRWDVVANCAPYEPWRVGIVAEPTGDIGEFVLRAADSGTSTIASPAAAGATSLSVATPAGDPLWSTVADDYPLQVEVGGVVVQVTACSGASSPQTFTVAATPKALTTGLVVAVYRPNLTDLYVTSI